MLFGQGVWNIVDISCGMYENNDVDRYQGVLDFLLEPDHSIQYGNLRVLPVVMEPSGRTTSGERFYDRYTVDHRVVTISSPLSRMEYRASYR